MISIATAQKQARYHLAHSPHLMQHTVQRARQMEVTAELMQKRLLRELPRLRAAVEAAGTDDERAVAQRNLLEATTNLHRCQQAFSLAKRQRIIASNL